MRPGSHQMHLHARGLRARHMGLVLRRGLQALRRWWRGPGLSLQLSLLRFG